MWYIFIYFWGTLAGALTSVYSPATGQLQNLAANPQACDCFIMNYKGHD